MLALTETGPPYLMPKNNNHIQEKELSIHSFVDGFSFCTANGPLFFPTPSSEEPFTALLEKFLKTNNTIEHFSWVSYEYPSLFVPDKYYHEDHKDRYIEHYTNYSESFKPNADFLKEHSLYNVYPQIKDLKKALASKGFTFRFSHANTLIYNAIYKSIDKQLDEKRFYINLQKHAFDLFIFEGKNLQLCNRFEYKTTDEFLYFLFFVIEQYQLEPNQFSILFLGQFAAFRSIYKAVKLYHKSVSFLDSETHSIIPLRKHQAPFLLKFSS